MKTFQRLTMILGTSLAVTTQLSAATSLTVDVSTTDVEVAGVLEASIIHKTGGNKLDTVS